MKALHSDLQPLADDETSPVSGGPRLTIGWHADRYDRDTASIRLRLHDVAAELRARDFQVVLPVDEHNLQRLDILILSKSLSSEAVRLAKMASDRGVAIVYDICDNVFEGKKGKKPNCTAIENCLRVMTLAQTVTISTATLAERLGDIRPELRSRMRIIPDMLDLSLFDQKSSLSLLDRLHLYRLRRFLSVHPRALHCVWFGKSHGPHAGIPHLRRAIERLEAADPRFPATLTVIGNRFWKYQAAARSWKIPSCFIPWSINTFATALRMHRTAIIPVERNHYTSGKTINRPATALLGGLDVVADPIESYEELRPYIWLDGLNAGLEHHFSRGAVDDAALSEARAYLLRTYGPRAIGDQWQRLLLGLGTKPSAPHGLASGTHG